MPSGDRMDIQKTDKQDVTQKERTETDKSDIYRYIDNQALRTNPFERSLTAEQIYQRAERIAAALFLITAHVRYDEPLRVSIRTGCIEFVEKALDVRLSLRSEQSPVSGDLLACIRRLVTQVRLLGISGYVSHPNVAVLVSALDEAGHLITSARRSSLSDMKVLSHEDLVPAQLELSRSVIRRASRPSIKDTVKEHVEHEVRTVDTSSRGDRILAVLRTRDLLGIKDISVSLPEYSEKMIQRELADLVAVGRVRKVGSKRWSRYGFVR